MRRNGRWRVGLAVGLACLWGGCGTVRPPERPVAYVFPTIREVELPAQVTPRNVTERDILGWLARAGILADVRAAGLSPEELSVFSRGLARNGYAELDLRKTRLDLAWIAMSCFSDGRVEILLAYRRDRGKNMTAGMRRTDLSAMPPGLQEVCAAPRYAVAGVWHGRTRSAERWYVVLADPERLTPVLWLKRLVLTDGR